MRVSLPARVRAGCKERYRVINALWVNAEETGDFFTPFPMTSPSLMPLPEPLSKSEVERVVVRVEEVVKGVVKVTRSATTVAAKG